MNNIFIIYTKVTVVPLILTNTVRLKRCTHVCQNLYQSSLDLVLPPCFDLTTLRPNMECVEIPLECVDDVHETIVQHKGRNEYTN